MDYDYFDIVEDREYQEKRRQLREEREKTKKRKMRKRAKIAVAVFLVVICLTVALSFAGYSSCQKNRFNHVKSLEVGEPAVNTVSLSWDQAPLAEGYIVYTYDKDGNELNKTTVEGADKTSLELQLEQSGVYKFAVAAYKDGGKTVGEASEKIEAYTVPEKQTAQALGVAVGRLDISWNANPKASFYEVQYSKNSDFSDAQSQVFEDVNIKQLQVNDLEPKSNYYVRTRSVLKINDEDTVSGLWSDTAGPVEILEKLSVDPNKPMIALTFDDGPGFNGASDRILDTLEKYGAHATFFMVGTNAERLRDNVKRKVALGCEIGNHTYDHEAYGENVSPESIRKCSDVLRDITGKGPTCFRSCGGRTTKSICLECESEGMPLFRWSVDTRDWETRNADAIYKETVPVVEDGDIVLMHEIYDSTADAVERIVPDLLGKGYQLVTVSELVTAKTGEPPVPGREYITANQTTRESHK